MDLSNYLSYLTDWLQETVKKTHTKGLLVGISGGIDSAVVAFLIKKAMKDHCYGLILPCESNSIDEQDAMLVANACGIQVTKIDLTPSYQTLKQEILAQTGFSIEQTKMALANTKVRLRMTTLYAVAQSLGYLVVGTDNWDEWYTGYFTKYGDGGVDLVPLVHLTKGEVWKAGELLGVPQKIINRIPTAGIIPGVNDEDELQVTYPEIDRFLLGETIDTKKIERLHALHAVSEHKRNPALKPESPKR